MLNNEVDLSNPWVRKLKNYTTTIFNKCPSGLYEDIIESFKDILESQEIDFSKIIQPKEFRNKIISPEQRLKTIQQYNIKKILETHRPIKEIEDEILNILHNYKLSLLNPLRKDEQIKALKYEKAEKTDLGDGYILPQQDTRLSSVRKNLFYDKDLVYVFQEEIPCRVLDTTTPYLQTLKLKINGVIDVYNMPTKYEVRCSHQKNGVECGNVVHFCDVHLNSQIKCTDSGGVGEGHIIKKPESAPVYESKEIYVYEGEDLSSEEPQELFIYSLIKLSSNISHVNAIYVNEKKMNYLLVISAKEEKQQLLKENIIQKSPDSFYFLNDLYSSIQNYLKEYHNIILTNQNKLIGQIISFMLINNIFYDIRMNAMFMGKSGSGKSIWAEYLIPLFSLNHKIVIGTDITRNRFIGGRSNMVSEMKNSLFSVGYIATQDLIFAEEGTNSLEKFHDPRLDQSNNIFHLLKVCSGRKIDVTIQGGGKVFPKASTVLVGNLEQLKFTQEYKWWVASKYKKLEEGQKQYNENWPLFKPVSYYIEVLKNRKLAEAHTTIRQNHKNLAGFHYITRLPPAEQVRYDFCIILEDDCGVIKKRRIQEDEKYLNNPKRELFIKELQNMFSDENGKVRKCPHELKMSINDYYNNEYYYMRNNFKNIFGVEKEINAHFENSIIQIMRQLIWINRQYYNPKNPDEGPLTEEEKKIIEYFLSFNYNTLSAEEANGSKKPRVNDYKDVEDAINIDVDLKHARDLQNEAMKEMLGDEDGEDLGF